MLARKQFVVNYQKCVSMIRQIKSSNDVINKQIGVVPDLQLFRSIDTEKSTINPMFANIEKIVNEMEISYIDPDSARKVAMVRQQLRVQKDRRDQLISNITSSIKIAQTNDKRSSGRPAGIQPSLNSKKATYSTSKPYQQIEAELHYDLAEEEKYVRERGKQIIKAQERLININNIVKETAGLTYSQGDKIDIIDERMSTAADNLSLSNSELKKANVKHKKWGKKYKIFGLVVIVLVGLVATICLLI